MHAHKLSNDNMGICIKRWKIFGERGLEYSDLMATVYIWDIYLYA